MEEDFEKNVSKVTDYISSVFNDFYVWKSLQRKEYNEIYKENIYFWNATLPSLQFSSLMGLAKLFDKRKQKDVLSIYYLIDLIQEKNEKNKIKEEIGKHQSSIKNLVIWRSNILVHYSIFFAHDSRKLFKKFPIKGEELENLMNLLERVLGMIESARTKTGQTYTFKIIKEGSQKDAENIMKKIEGGCKREEEEFKKKFSISNKSRRTS